MNKYITELIGTFFLVLVIGLTGNPIAIGIILMVMVYMGGPISGGHFNPAVSLGVCLRGKLSLKDFFIYMLFQIIGAILAALTYWLFMKKTFAPVPGPDHTYLAAIFAEFLFTFALVLVVLTTATSVKSEGNSYFGLAIGLTVLAGAFSVGPISGAALNPAVGTGPILVNDINGGSSLKFLPIYLIGPFIGGAFAALVYRLTNKDEYENE